MSKKLEPVPLIFTTQGAIVTRLIKSTHILARNLMRSWVVILAFLSIYYSGLYLSLCETIIHGFYFAGFYTGLHCN